MRFRLASSIISFALIVAACGGGGGGGGNGNNNGPNLPNPPAAPTSVAVVGGNNSVEVSWSGSSSATGYNVYWSTSAGVTPQNGTRESALASPYTIAGLTNGTTYYVVVTATNAGGEGSPSAEVSASAEAALPARATLRLAEAGDASITVEWFDQSDADSYTVYIDNRADSSSGPEAYPNATSPYVVNGLQNGDLHRVTVVAVNSAGEGQESNFEDVTPFDSVANWQQQFRLFDPTDGEQRLVDLAVNDNGVAVVLWSEGASGQQPRLHVSHNLSGSWSDKFVLSNATGASAVVAPDNMIYVTSAADRLNVRLRRFENGVWQDPEILHQSVDAAARFVAQMAADEAGNLYVVWVEVIAGASTVEDTHDVWVRRYDAATEVWEPAVMIGSAVATTLFHDVKATNGRALVTWIQNMVPCDTAALGCGDQRALVYAARFDGNDWVNGVVVSPNDLVEADENFRVAMDLNGVGDAFVSWIVTRGAAGAGRSFEVGATRFDGGNETWGAPEYLETGSNSSNLPMITVDNSGGAVMHWEELNRGLSESRYDPTTSTWSAISQLPVVRPLSADEFTSLVDGAGERVFLSTSKRSPQETGLWITRLAAGSTSWSPLLRIGTMDAFKLHTATSQAGHVIIGIERGIYWAGGPGRAVYFWIYTP
ncbi:MAG: fibronectin type III domain-containing protein [Pseudomonadota bacterium]